jgi:hypothetical protein
MKLNKMVKRKRTSFGDIGDDQYCMVEYYGKQYWWYVADKAEFHKLINEVNYVCEVIHNSDGQAMIDFSDVSTGETVFRQEINPIEHKNADEWVVDK